MKNRYKSILALGAVGALALSGCAASTDEVPTVGNGNDDQKAITIAVFNGWDEGIATSELWKAILDEKGYTAELEYADVAPVFSGLSSGDYDFTLDVWAPSTHANFIKEYGADLTDLGSWNDEASLTIAVNEDAPIDSLTELAANADLFGNRIVGIEPGAGLTAAVTDKVIPTYGLEDMEFLTSSTAAMLTELTAATSAGENIVVTLWQPHWVYSSIGLKNLTDPEGTLGDAEGLHAYGKGTMEADYPQAAKWLSNFTMDLDQLGSLENAMFVEYDGNDFGPIVAKWIEDNQDYVDSLTS
ncbi:glycine betaine ABC transporter substrate-binding protein [Cryobacterium sp. PH31-L1]|uniref:glycine betaine ABC transporter substrate-binding protein n=1 Tax=Cryobacterium sp. PH31-L1 TaxID=3046199 RepID=UPI0024BBEA0B|nr:glycine betaine ABC transporter substrate-binding protein [Cryobacterium sp. PH31-L1]MDJ0378594.1 glycine betaine ABC transporter substrate-binding protein [Cryobacterium sp. PH31-L1]